MQKDKVKGHLVSKLEWKETNGRTEAIALPPVLTRSVSKSTCVANNSQQRDFTQVYLKSARHSDCTTITLRKKDLSFSRKQHRSLYSVTNSLGVTDVKVCVRSSRGVRRGLAGRG